MTKKPKKRPSAKLPAKAKAKATRRPVNAKPAQKITAKKPAVKAAAKAPAPKPVAKAPAPATAAAEIKPAAPVVAPSQPKPAPVPAAKHTAKPAAPPPPPNPVALAELLKHYPAERSNLIPLLQLVQEKFGWLHNDSMAAIASYLHVPGSVVFGVATFYAQFYFQPQGRHKVKVCQGTACHVRGSKAIVDQVGSTLGIKDGETTPDLKVSLERVACFGSCALAPVMVVDDKVHGRVTMKKALKIVEGLE